MAGSATLYFGLMWLAAAAGDAAPTPAHAAETIFEPPRFRVDAPTRVLTDVPVQRVIITALTPEGATDAHYDGQPYVTGVRLVLPTSDDAKLGAFSHGVLELTTDLTQGRKVYITDPEIIVDPEGRNPVSLPVRRINRWWSLLPLLVAVGLAIWLRNALVPMFAAVLCGAVVLANGNPLTGFLITVETYLLGAIVPRSGSQGSIDYSHLHVLCLTLFLGALAGVVSAGGGLSAMSGRLERFSRTRERGQLLGCGLCLFTAFDQTVSALLLGPLLRPITDRLKISREKLAFVIDSAAASLGGLLLVSLAFSAEFSAVHDAYSHYGFDGASWSTLLASIPFRFYPIYLLAFVLLVAFLGQDFGPMLRAESRALNQNHMQRASAMSAFESAEMPVSTARREFAGNFLIPATGFVVLVAVGVWWTGTSRLDALNLTAHNDGVRETAASIVAILQNSSPVRVLFLSSFLASVLAVLMAVSTRALSLSESLAAWSNGARSMFLPLALLVLAWSFERVCSESQLNTAGFLVELLRGEVSIGLVPALGFLLAALVAFVTGSQVATTALLMPLFVAVAHSALVDLEQAAPTHRLMLATIGAIITGAICGRQVSLFSPATIMAAAGAGSDHCDHVATQLPYILAVGGVSLLLGYIPAGMGYSPGMLLPLGTLALFLVVQFLGRPASQADAVTGAPVIPGAPVSSGAFLPTADPASLSLSAVDDMLKEVEAATSGAAAGGKSAVKSKK